MANFRLQISSISRSAGRSATAAAAYRSGERIRDQRSGELHNYSRREDVLHKEIVLPSQLAGASVDWARDRATLWNVAEQAETRRTARVAREIQVTLPAELSAPQRLQLAQRFSQEVADRYNIAVDLAIHQPRDGSDPRNFHAHLLGTTREMRTDGLGSKAGLDLPRGERQRLGLPTHSQEFTNLRERWATLTNDALREANIDARVDHRSLQAQGIDREPRPRIPFAAFQIERKGEISDVAQRLRTEHQSRVQARREQSHRSTEPATQRSLADIRREAREAWLKLRASAVQQPSEAPGKHVRDQPSALEAARHEASEDLAPPSPDIDDDHSI